MAQDPRFGQAQHDFIQRTHYDPLAQRARQMGIDADQRSAALRDVLWSTGVQHGAGGGASVLQEATKRAGGAGASDERLIDEIYAARRTRFGSSEPEVRASVQRRFTDENAQARRMLASERASSTQSAARIGEAIGSKPQQVGAAMSGAPAMGSAMLSVPTPVSATPASAMGSAADIGSALTSAVRQSAGTPELGQQVPTVVGKTQAEPQHANDNFGGLGEEAARAVGAEPWGPMPGQAPGIFCWFGIVEL